MLEARLLQIHKELTQVLHVGALFWLDLGQISRVLNCFLNFGRIHAYLKIVAL